ncbi:uncharacterized protein Z519_02996 [Cladophialophora bantiana CBS 173.52]|uniref:Uncharacterized protein n=1 Tax=Cladophialophora bantiana (strain ATCC 10958 / CBS 173.52 / CDC B-1940 / NIH 8579) TaxID=1442370 RepID=A0A0D2HYB7_CLAB1|nr:uncharacterized protein Z519_02996 [Cladophialophora bantiana CBS 173.52]KIW95930.1 hypothetical protein Z519_02996 [Cladophialophora bantiana CBS 173.52]
MEEIPIFRAAKRRKFIRFQQEPFEESATTTTPTDDAPSAGGDGTRDDDGDEGAISNLIRARKHVRKVVSGVQFSNAKVMQRADDTTSTEAARSDQIVDKPIDIVNRFVGSTGQVVNVDKHMVAFIDSEMAKRRSHLLTSSNASQENSEEEPNHSSSSSDRPVLPVQKPSTTNPASTRQLAEVDLGNSVHDSNLARTQAALERVKAGQAPVEEVDKPRRPRKPRLGRDGKPMKPRPRKRRNSEDIARDALVEQFLHENRIDLYDTNSPGPTSGRPLVGEVAEEGDTDERFAEQFRQDFMDAMAERRNKNKYSSQSKGTSTAEPRGPKLGGSRNARAKMMQQQQQGQAGTKK